MFPTWTSEQGRQLSVSPAVAFFFFLMRGSRSWRHSCYTFIHVPTLPFNASWDHVVRIKCTLNGTLCRNTKSALTNRTQNLLVQRYVPGAGVPNEWDFDLHHHNWAELSVFSYLCGAEGFINDLQYYELIWIKIQMGHTSSVAARSFSLVGVSEANLINLQSINSMTPDVWSCRQFSR